MKFLPMFDNLIVFFILEFIGVSNFHDVCFTDPLDPFLMLYIERIWGFVKIHEANLVI